MGKIWFYMISIGIVGSIITNNLGELNKVILKTGDSLDIVESSTLPLTEKLMYKVEHEKDKIIVRRDGGKMVIPVDNILFASSIPLDVIHEDLDDEI